VATALSQLTAFAETAKVCRHISICRFFGENIDDKDPAMLAAYCAGMCDVRHCQAFC
jgi:hypothetical protein